MSGKRKRADGEKDEEVNREYSRVVCKWGHVCMIKALDSEFQHSCSVINQAQLEAWHVANLHLLRCFTDSIALSKSDSTFFNHCCSGVLEREKECKDSLFTIR